MSFNLNTQVFGSYLKIAVFQNVFPQRKFLNIQVEITESVLNPKLELSLTQPTFNNGKAKKIIIPQFIVLSTVYRESVVENPSYKIKKCLN